MSRPRFSLRWLLGSVSFVAIGCGLLVYARPVTACLSFAATLLVLFAAIPISVYRSGSQRAFWFGFALFGLAYFCLACGPWAAPDAYLQVKLRDRLPTMKILEFVHQRLPTKTVTPASGMGGGMFGQMGMGGMGPMGGGSGIGMGGMGMGGPPTVTVPITDWDDFAVVGHSLWAIIIAVIGGGIASWCQRTQVT